MSEEKSFFGINEKEVAGDLAKNPKYDADWINAAATLLSKYPDYTVDDLEDFSADQLTVIKTAFEKYSGDQGFAGMIFNPELNSTQMQILLAAKNAGVDNSLLTPLTDPSLTYTKGNYISKALADGINMAKEIDFHMFDNDQIYEIFAGMESGIDYHKYLDNTFSAEEMGIIRHALELGLEVKVDPDLNQIILVRK